MTIEVDRAGALLKVGNGFGCKQRLPERLDRTDIRNMSAASNRNANSSLHDIRARIGCEFAFPDQFIRLKVDQNSQIERLSGFNPSLHDGGNIRDHDQPMAARPLELRTDVLDDHLGHARTENLYLGAGRRACRDDDESGRHPKARESCPDAGGQAKRNCGAQRRQDP